MPLSKQKKSVVGLDLGTHAIKAVEITQDRYDWIITAFSRVEVPGESAREEAVV